MPVDWSSLPEALAAIDEGRAFVDLSGRRKVMVAGSESRAWLHDLLTADVEGLSAGTWALALLLSPTGKIRAAVSAAALDHGFLLIQDPAQPSGIEELLSPYVLSSDVSLEDVTDRWSLLAVAGPIPSPAPGGELLTPSVLGWPADLLIPAEDGAAARDALAERGGVAVGLQEVEAWRIIHGMARFPWDLTPESLPHEADLEDAIDYEKGCYLGQEAVARVRNLGHPPWVVRAFRSPAPARRGMPLVAGGVDAGRVTSAAQLPGGEHALLARVRWAHRDASPALPDGHRLTEGSTARGMA